MRVAVIGLPGSGKSSVFTALTGTRPEPGNPVPVSVEVPDERLERLRDMYQPKKYSPARIEFTDVPGPTGDESRRADILNRARDADVLLHVVRAFDNPAYPHPEGSVDPVRDRRSLEEELVLADLFVLEKRLDKLSASEGRQGQKAREEQEEAAILRPVRDGLEQGTEVRDQEQAADHGTLLRGFGLLTLKPRVTLWNTPSPDDDAGAPDDALALSAAVEAEVGELDPEDRDEFAAEMGLERPGAPAVIRACHDAAGLMSFFTVGDDEVRAWTVARGADAVTCAGCIHSDLARGFIRAEVTPGEELLRLGSEKAAKDEGATRVEGASAVIHDGDVVHVRFSV